MHTIAAGATALDTDQAGFALNTGIYAVDVNNCMVVMLTHSDDAEVVHNAVAHVDGATSADSVRAAEPIVDVYGMSASLEDFISDWGYQPTNAFVLGGSPGTSPGLGCALLACVARCCPTVRSVLYIAELCGEQYAQIGLSAEGAPEVYMDAVA